MRPTIIGWILLSALTSTIAVGQSLTNSPALADAEIRKILSERVDMYRQSVGIVVGIIGPSGRRVIAYGVLDQGDKRPLDGDTVFEIGSSTKVFTALLLADMVERGEVALTDPVAKFLPIDAKVPQWNGREITLVDLATHTSGLPRDPTNLDPKELANPFADYDVRQLDEFLAGYHLTRDIGSRFEYSNVGIALLGQALTARAAMDYESLVEARITTPLAMASTRISLTPDMKSRLAVGHSYVAKEPVPSFATLAYTPAGGLRSTANDLLTFLAVNMGYASSPLAPAMTAMLKVRRPPMVLGWGTVNLNKGSEIISHIGGTNGMTSFIGFDPKTRLGVVVLSNTGGGGHVDDIGYHLLNLKAPLLSGKSLPLPVERKQVAVDPHLFDGYVGRYQISKGDVLTVTRDGGRLFVQRTAELKDEMYPENNLDYFAKLFDDQISFKTNAQGRATEVIYRENGAALRAKRVE